MNDVAAVVVTYNRLALLKQCVEHLLKQTCPCDVLIVDNASTDGTDEWASTLDDTRITHLRLKENTGGAGGFHCGMKYAVEQKYPFVWIMDDDTLPEPCALERLLEADALLEGNYGFLSSVVLWTDGTECRMNRPKLKKAYYKRIELLQHGLILAEQATFVSCFFHSKTIVNAGLPIKEFFIWGDDIEYTRRLAVRLKMPCYLVGKSLVIHSMEHNRGSDIIHDDVNRIARYHYAYRNENYLYRQEGLYGICYYLARCGLHLIHVWLNAKDNRIKRSYPILKQLLCGLFFQPTIEYIKK